MEETRREQERTDCDIILNKVEAGHRNICRATNISLSGMQFMRLLDPHRRAAEEEGRIRLQFALPGQEDALNVDAERVYDDEDGFVGVRFVNISHQHFIRLREWLREQSISDVPIFRGE
jgi:hypothetical protein